MRVVVPFDARRPKTRLADALDPDERRGFATAMLRDVLAALRGEGVGPELLATASVDVDAPATIDRRPLATAVNDVLAGDGPVAVVMADLPLLTADAVERLLSADGDVVLAPGRGGGTNALVARHPDFRVDYHGVSIRDHRRIAASLGAELTEVDSYRLSTDIDERGDLPEVLLHGGERSRDWLRDRGFRVGAVGDRVRFVREGPTNENGNGNEIGGERG
jgi:2-phospho-L-lactate guanylyltransferase